MNLFRSEEHITCWLGGRTPGATISIAKLSELAHAWWGDRVAPGGHARLGRELLVAAWADGRGEAELGRERAPRGSRSRGRGREAAAASCLASAARSGSTRSWRG